MKKDSKKDGNKITIRSLVYGTIFSGLFAILTVYFENTTSRSIVTANQLAVLPYVLLILGVLLINPLCRLIRIIKPFTLVEILIVFIMGSVSAGVSTFGLASQLVPIMGNMMNRHWNTEQSEWNQYVVPYLKDGYFISEPGMQEASQRYRDAVAQLNDASSTYKAVLEYKKAGGALAEAEARLGEEAVKIARRTYQEAQSKWQKVSTEFGGAEVQEILASLENRIKVLKGEMQRRREELAALETKAFAKVEVFRRGLPKGQRALPGFIHSPREGSDVYLGRVRRLLHGRRALGYLVEAKDIVGEADPNQPLSRQAAEESSRLLSKCLEKLEPIRELPGLLERRDALSEKWEQKNQEFLAASLELEELRAARRKAPASEFSSLDRKINRLDNKVKDVSDEKEHIERDRDRIDMQVIKAEKVVAAIGSLESLKEAINRPNTTAGELSEELSGIMGSFGEFDASLKKFILGDVPWGDWIRPLFNWAVAVVIVYVVLMSFNLLIFRHWAYNEKLIYPLVELPEALAGVGEKGQAAGVPPIFRSGLFWMGAGISGMILGWNLLCKTELVPGLTAIDLTNVWSPYIKNTMFAGLMPKAKSGIFFTLIGLSFMVPAHVSFSLWFFWILSMMQLLVLVWLGYGVNQNSFPTEFWYTFNFCAAEGGGALIVFASVILYKCRKYILCFFMPAAVTDLKRAERMELRISSFLFIFGSIGLILVLWRGMGANLLYTILCYMVILCITIGLVRAVTEGGVLGFQAHVSPFHLIRTLFGMGKTWTSAKLFAPLVIFYAVLFLDIKTLIAPAMANSIKMREDMHMKRIRFHLAVGFGILVAAACAIAAQLILSYGSGADSMHPWFHTSFAKQTFDRVGAMVRTPPEDTSNNIYWLLFGAVAMAALLYGRRFIFWLPHPIGMIMLVNPIMSVYWFSIMIGWLAKTLVTKYGGRNTYRKVRCLFIGLIFGELLIIVLAMILSQYLDIKITIDLNR